MNVRSPKLWIGLFSAAAVLWIVADDMGRTSPGPVSTVHGRIAEIDGGASCAQCHGGWFSDMTTSCLACHEPIASQIESGDGLHGRLGEERARRCAECHSEHHGGEFQLVNRRSFAVAGLQGPEGFDHAFVGFEMAGKHLELDCTKCHEHADAVVLPEGAHRYIGLEQSCASCHDDPHEGRMQIGCAKCHSQESWDQLGSLGHEEFLPLIGGHAEVGCRKCHEKDSAQSLESFGAGRRGAERACATCHDSPHAESFIASIARLEGTSDAASCVQCHEHEHLTFHDEVEMTPERHACSGFELVAPHDAAACADCHAEDAATFALRYPARGPNDCAKCHEDPHGGQFESGPFAASCVECHERTQFEPHAFSVEHHARSNFELTGRHLSLECEECHKDPAEGEPRQFHDIAQTCDDCHRDAHAGFFDRHARAVHAAPLAELMPDSCAGCHTTETFARADDHSFDHERWTGFALHGAHAESNCEACHHPRDEADVTGRMFGRVADHYGEFTGCKTCHNDPHRGLFDKKDMPKQIDGRADCARCHVPSSFRAFPNGFEHGRWTGFELRGAHRSASCSACHEPLMEADSSGRTWGAARGTRCADCHTDPHAGQFRKNGTTDCRRCHDVGETFRADRFDHDRHSRFPLGDAHKNVACAKCHKARKVGDESIVRYRPLRHQCVDCHGSTEDPLRRRRRR